MKKRRVYVDMDGVLADFDAVIKKVCKDSGVKCLTDAQKDEAMNSAGFFMSMPVIKDAHWGMVWLDCFCETYILSTAPWDNPRSWMEKRLWVEENFPLYKKRLILSHNKQLHIGDFLVDDRTTNGASEFEGELIMFGSESFPDWKSVIYHLESRL